MSMYRLVALFQLPVLQYTGAEQVTHRALPTHSVYSNFDP